MIDNEVQVPVETPIEQPTEPVASPEQIEQEQPKKTPSEIQEANFKAIREKAKRAEQERDELARRLQELERAKVQQPQEDDEISLAPDDLAEGKHLTKVSSKIKKLEAKLQQYESHSKELAIEAQIKSQFPDFDKVVSQDSLNNLKDEYPEVFNTLNSSPDLYSKAVSAYTLIKKFGITDSSAYAADVEKAQKNMAKPKPLASISPQQGDSPLSKANAFANGLTDELKTQLYKEMIALRKGY